MTDSPTPGGWGTRLLLRATRVALPVLIALSGVVLIVIGQATGSATDTHGTSSTTAAAGVGLILAAIIVWMINWMYRMSLASNRERDAEEAAREYFERHGHWPGEGPG